MLRCFFLFLALCLVGCFASRNSEYSVRVPVARFSFKPNVDENVYQMIDTASFYFSELINGQYMMDGNDGKPRDIRLRRGGLKFYADGRVGSFNDTDLSDVSSFDPRKASMGLYSLSKKGFFIAFASHSPQAGVFIIKETILSKGDTLIVKNDSYEYKYLRKKLPDQLLVFKPDW